VKYTLIYTQGAERDIAGLDSKTKERIGKALLNKKDLTHSEVYAILILAKIRGRGLNG
jgi:hypothetical protein